ncbi:hypothetical protein KTQ42_20205 [Noviherbaspirillum sp. L7-7A]|uniref:hypothetical protein n=1 Tax=Noviherbaspirillum sp. L7-7A TaxID=2850560 RepID=UPI001C2C7A5F|nr:hypothetical protein [Noviherbaspirillum sp. L7-7A]MBV0881607.1 hypothetical protein [Noviherbaspirillum sp. L7-7A]
MASVPACRESANVLAELVILIDSQLTQIDYALNQLQPGKTGKLRINWWKKRGKLVPSVAKWIYVKKIMKWRAERINLDSLVLSVRSSVEFKADAPVVKELMRRTKMLLQLRARALQIMQNFQHASELLNKANADKLTLLQSDLNGLIEALKNRTDSRDSEPEPSSPVLLEMAPEDDD